jgi:urate oxidase
MENFVAVIKSRKMEDLNCSIQAGAHVASVAQMGNISYRSGQKLIWDANAGQFSDKKINKLYLEKEYHNGYVLPKLS